MFVSLIFNIISYCVAIVLVCIRAVTTQKNKYRKIEYFTRFSPFITHKYLYYTKAGEKCNGRTAILNLNLSPFFSTKSRATILRAAIVNIRTGEDGDRILICFHHYKLSRRIACPTTFDWIADHQLLSQIAGKISVFEICYLVCACVCECAVIVRSQFDSPCRHSFVQLFILKWNVRYRCDSNGTADSKRPLALKLPLR